MNNSDTFLVPGQYTELLVFFFLFCVSDFIWLHFAFHAIFCPSPNEGLPHIGFRQGGHSLLPWKYIPEMGMGKMKQISWDSWTYLGINVKKRNRYFLACVIAHWCAAARRQVICSTTGWYDTSHAYTIKPKHQIQSKRRKDSEPSCLLVLGGVAQNQGTWHEETMQ